MDLKSLNRPGIPVRQNRRTQLKPLSRLNGDWLPMLKKIRTSEMSQQVRGHNASEELRTRRLVEQWFGDFAWQLGKLKKAQGVAMTDLARLHLERRQVRRHMVLWRQEEARQQAIRDQERESRREEMERVAREIERRTKQLQREGRRMSQRLNAALFPAGRRGSRQVVDPSEPPADPEPPQPVATEAEAGPAPKETPDPEETPAAPPRREASNQMVKARVLEVAKGRPEPLVRTRSKSDLSDDPGPDASAARPLPPIPRAEPAPRRSEHRGRKSGVRCSFPTIEEDRDFDPAPSPASSRVPRALSVEVRAPAPSPAPTPALRKSVVDENRERMRRTKEMQEAILREPYAAYRRDSRGRLQSLDHPPPPPSFHEPSNRGAYRRTCLLRSEREAFDAKLQSLESFTDSCVQEDMRQMKELQQPKAKPEEVKPRLDEKFDENRKMGPADWMRVFIHSSLPEGVDPADPENLEHCRYLRKDAEEDEEDGGGQKRVKDRVSSWDPVSIA